MTDPVTPPSISPEEEVRAAPEPAQPADFSASGTWGERIFEGPGGVRVVWRILIYLCTGGGVFYLVLWFGASFFQDPVRGVAVLWSAMYQEMALLLGAIVPAFLMASIEGHRFDDYGLPRNQAFRRLFWSGAGWGLAAITFLLIVLRGTHVFYFGHIVLHGGRVLKFALFWAAFFLVVGLFEEFLTRGYLLFTLKQGLGFWPAAVLLSCLFGAIHLRNPGEGPVGILGAAAIGFFFCLTLRRTGSLWFAVGFHLAWDWGQSYLWGVADSGSIVPGHLFGPSVVDRPVWLTGGSVGPEGSVLCLVLIVVLWVVFARTHPEVKYEG
jgi:membrane protease YdiL (CAAX protease family)